MATWYDNLTWLNSKYRASENPNANPTHLGNQGMDKEQFLIP